LDQWIEVTNDPLAMDEIEVIKTRVWPTDGEQPTTADPELNIRPIGRGASVITITCPTEGASIGYREKKDSPWKIYTKPFATDAREVEISAHRLGWKPSIVTSKLE
jgi:N-sulfoglucosamine sulfohydrolase